MQGDDPHEVLGVAKNASEDEIKEAYRDKVKQYHPDVSDVPDAERKFRRVRQAYDVLLSPDPDGTDTDTGNSEQPTETHNRTRRSRKDRSRTDTGPGSRSGGGTERGFEVIERYGDGWNLAVCGEGKHVGEWFVYRDDRSGTGRRYLDHNGEISEEKVYFGTKRQAERGYGNHSGEEGTRGRESGSDRTGQKNGSRRRSRSRTRTGAQKPTGGGDEVRGEEVGGFDSLWTLYRSEDDGGWAVVSETFGSPYYLNRAGEQQREGFWFDSRPEAEEAYEAYMRGAEDVGGPSRNLTSGFGSSDDGRERRREETTRKVERETAGRRPPVSALGTVLESIGLKGLRLNNSPLSAPKAGSSLADRLPQVVRGLLTFIGVSVVVYLILRLLLSLIAGL